MATFTSFPCTQRNPIETLVQLKPSSSSSLSPSFSFTPFSLRPNIKHLACKNVKTKCSLDNQDLYEPATKSYPKPSEIQWKKELCNSVQLIGIVGLPVQLNHLGSGKVVASTRLAVRKSQTDTSWVNLTFWDELAHIAHQHVEKGHQIYVSGRLVSDTVEGEDGKQQTYYKVVVQQLNFVERNAPSPVALYNGSSNSVEAAGKFNNSSATNRSSTQELWQAFFANPVDWWDNRKNKVVWVQMPCFSIMNCDIEHVFGVEQRELAWKNPKYPDFKHKDTGEALWVEAKYNPPWVKSQLEILDSRMQAVQNKDDSGLFNYLNGV